MAGQVRDQVARLLRANLVEEGGVRYSRPAHVTYPHQWLWDSCFHATIYHALGRDDLAADELRALFREQQAGGPDAGRLPHMTFRRHPDPRDGGEGAAYQRDVALWGDPRASTISQPPIVAETVHLLGDSALWRELWPGLGAYYDWWLRRRDPEGVGLCAIWHLWECGADATPRGDDACRSLLASGRAPRHLDKRTSNPTAQKQGPLLRARFLMLEELQRIDTDEREGRVDTDESQRQRRALLGLEAVEMQAYLVQNLLALASIGEALGEDEAAQRYRRAAARTTAAVNELLWDEAQGFYFDRAGLPPRAVRAWTFAPFVALYAGELVPRERAQRLLGHLLDPERFWTRWPVPSVSRHEETFSPDEYWRGSTWINVNWFVARGLVSAAGRFADGAFLRAARTIAERTVALVARLGFREYYRSGASTVAGDASAEPRGFGPEGFGWSGLVLLLQGMLDGPLAGVEAQP